MTGQALDKIVRDSIQKDYNGYDFPHGTGHGIGVCIHEGPRINKIYDQPLPENCVFTIEPGIYLDNKFGIRIEDSIVLTKKGAKVLTKAVDKKY
jgi:Xaa-Pro aminopeptidase